MQIASQMKQTAGNFLHGQSTHPTTSTPFRRPWAPEHQPTINTNSQENGALSGTIGQDVRRSLSLSPNTVRFLSRTKTYTTHPTAPSLGVRIAFLPSKSIPPTPQNRSKSSTSMSQPTQEPQLPHMEKERWQQSYVWRSRITKFFSQDRIGWY